jgi:hypothetical protein
MRAFKQTFHLFYLYSNIKIIISKDFIRLKVKNCAWRLYLGVEKWGPYRETGERGTAPIFLHKNVGLMNQAPTEESIPREMGTAPIFTYRRIKRLKNMFNFF